MKENNKNAWQKPEIIDLNVESGTEKYFSVPESQSGVSSMGPS